MNPEEAERLVLQLVDLTRSGKIEWTQKSADGPAAVGVGRFIVVLSSRDGDGGHPYFMRLERRDRKAPPVHLNASEEVDPDLVRELWTTVTRQTSGLEEFASELFSDLESIARAPEYGDEEPF